MHLFSVLFLRSTSKNFRRFSSVSPATRPVSLAPSLLFSSFRRMACLAKYFNCSFPLKAPNMHTKRDSSEHYLSIFKVWLWNCSSLIERKLGSVSKREREEEKKLGYSGLDEFNMRAWLGSFLCLQHFQLFFRTCWLLFVLCTFAIASWKRAKMNRKHKKKLLVCAKHHAPMQLQAEMILYMKFFMRFNVDALW